MNVLICFDRCDAMLQGAGVIMSLQHFFTAISAYFAVII